MQLHVPHIFMLLATITCVLAACEKNTQSTTLSPAAGEMADTGSFISPDEALRMAEAFKTSGAYTDALNVIAVAYRRFPGNAAVVSEYGRLALINGQDELAKHLLAEALAITPDDWRALSAQGVLESRGGNVEDARRMLTLASSTSGEDAVALNNLAIAALLDGEPERAVPLLARSLASPGLKPVHRERVKRNMALALLMQGRVSEAEAYANKKFPQPLDRAAIQRLIGVSSVPMRGARPSANSWVPVIESAGS